MRTPSLFAFALIAVPLLACTQQQPANAETRAKPKTLAAMPLAGTRWQLQTLGGRPVGPTPSQPFVIFDAKTRTISGSGGCNALGGPYQRGANGKVRFGMLMSTAMACAKGMDIESDVHAKLSQVDGYTIKGRTLQLNRTGKGALMTFTAAR